MEAVGFFWLIMALLSGILLALRLMLKHQELNLTLDAIVDNLLETDDETKELIMSGRRSPEQVRRIAFRSKMEASAIPWTLTTIWCVVMLIASLVFPYSDDLIIGQVLAIIFGAISMVLFVRGIVSFVKACRKAQGQKRHENPPIELSSEELDRVAPMLDR